MVERQHLFEKHLIPTTDVQTQNIGKLRYANRRAPTKCQHTVATQATEYQRWRDVGCRSRRCRPMPTLGQRRNASWGVSILRFTVNYTTVIHPEVGWQLKAVMGWFSVYSVRNICQTFLKSHHLLGELHQPHCIFRTWLMHLRCPTVVLSGSVMCGGKSQDCVVHAPQLSSLRVTHE